VKKILLALFFIGSSLFGAVGEAGSSVDIDEVKLKVELIKDDNTTVTILDGTKYLKINGSSSTATSIGQALEGIKPAVGTYTHVRWTPMGFRIKVKFIDNGTTYYSTNTTVPEDDTTSWQFSTTETDYASTIITQGAVTHTVTVKFPTALVVSEDKAVDLFYVSKFTGDVQYSIRKATMADQTWVSNTLEAFGFITNTPAKIAQFDLIYNKSGTDYKNKISLLFDENNNILGSHSSEGTGGAERALSGGFIKESNTTSTGYTITTEGEGFPQVVSFDFNLSNCSNYSNLTVDRWQSSNPDMTGGTLTTTGNVTCSDINITE